MHESWWKTTRKLNKGSTLLGTEYFQIYLSMWVSLWDAVVTNVVLNLEVRVCFRVCVWVFWQLATLFSMHLRTHSVFPCHTDARSMHICMHAYTSIGTNTCPLLNCKHKEMLIFDGSGGGGGGDDGTAAEASAAAATAATLACYKSTAYTRCMWYTPTHALCVWLASSSSSSSS